MEIYTSNGLEVLLDILAEEVKGGKSDVSSIFSRPKELVVIQSSGMAKWLKQNLALKSGISANIDFPFLKNFILDVLISYGYSNEENIWDKDTLTWRIFKMLPRFESQFPVLEKYIAGEERRRCQLAEKLGSLYDQYMVYRQDWIDCWTAGRKASVKPGSFEALGSVHEEWQMAIWQELCLQSNDSFQRTLMNFISRRDFSREQLKLPEKISIFGVTNMPAVFIDFFEALSAVCELRFFYLNPCAEYWGDISTKKSLFIRQNKDEIPDSPNALLKAWGLLGRDFLNLLLDRTEFDVKEFFAEPQGNSVLEQIQSSILNMDERFYIYDFFDESIKVNACHNPRRELEVLHDYILGILADNGDVEPRDIIVMAPDIQVYSPYIHSIFADENALPFSVSDQSVRSSPLVNTYCNILQLYKSRLSGNDILEILEHPDVLAKFKLSVEDIPQIREWIKDAAIRWGKDAEYRAELGLPAFEQNSWKFGFDRLLAGYAFSDELLYEDSLAVPIGENGVTLGRLKTAVDTLFEIEQTFKKAHPASEWCQILQKVLRDCVAENNENSNEQNFITQSISRLEKLWQFSELEEELSAETVIKAFCGLLDETSSSYGFLDKGITFCSLLPMRSIPAKMVCLLGMNEGEFPRTDKETGFDLISLHWRQGDRTKRLDDRYLFLESLLSARKYFYVSFRGMDENENTRIPPSIVVAEFLEFLRSVDANKFAVQYHPLHSFSPKYFDISDEEFLSYSYKNFKSAEAHISAKKENPAFCRDELPFAPGFVEDGWIHLSLKDFSDFFKHPAKHFLKHQTGTSLWQESFEELADTEAFEKLDSLSAYILRREMLEKILENTGELESDSFEKDLKKSVLAKGELQYGLKGEEELETLYGDCRAMADKLLKLQDGHEEEKILLEVAFPGRRLVLSGNIKRVFGNSFIPFNVGKCKFKHLFTATIYYLALVQNREASLQLLAKERDYIKVFKSLKKVSPETAARCLLELVDIYLAGMKKPMPFISDCFDEFLKGDSPDNALIKARSAWYPSYSNSFPPSSDEANKICFGEEFPGDNPDLKDAFFTCFDAVKNVYDTVWGEGRDS